jgi:hypothetical protein
VRSVSIIYSPFSPAEAQRRKEVNPKFEYLQPKADPPLAENTKQTPNPKSETRHQTVHNIRMPNAELMNAARIFELSSVILLFDFPYLIFSYRVHR